MLIDTALSHFTSKHSKKYFTEHDTSYGAYQLYCWLEMKNRALIWSISLNNASYLTSPNNSTSVTTRAWPCFADSFYSTLAIAVLTQCYSQVHSLLSKGKWWQQHLMLFESTGKVYAAKIKFPESAGENFTDWIQSAGHQLDHTLN